MKNLKTPIFEDINDDNNKKPENNDQIIDSIKQKEEILKDNYVPLLNIPSKFLHYKEGTRIFGKPMNVKDIKSLASMDESNYKTIINQVLARNIKGIDINNILKFDKYFFIFFLRANTYRDAGYEIDYFCDKCKKNSHYDFTINALNIEYCKEDSIFDITLPTCKTKLKLRYETIGDEVKLDEFIRIAGGNIKDLDLSDMELANQIELINGEDKAIGVKYDFVQKLTPVDFAALITQLDLISFGVVEVIETECQNFVDAGKKKKCGGKMAQPISFRPEFFIPKIRL